MRDILHAKPNTMTRRRFLGTTAISIAAPALLSACKSDSDELNVMAWAVYVSPEIIGIMGKAGIKVRPIPAESDQEMFTKLKAGGSSAYDIVFANTGWAPTYNKAGLIETFDAAEVRGADQIYSVFLEDKTFPYIVEPGKLLAFPNMWDRCGMVWNTEHAKPAQPYSWMALWDPAIQPGKVLLRGGPEDFLAMSGLSLGVPRDQIFTMKGDQLDAAAEHLAKLKPFQIINSDTLFEDSIRTGESWIGMASTSSVAMRANRVAGKNIAENTTPVEGTVGWVDGAQIVKGTKKRDLAIKFIEVWNGPDIQNYLITNFGYPQCNRVENEKALARGGEMEADLRARGADKPEGAREMLFQGPPEDPAAWAQAYDRIIGA
ncbi:ABC transporter substrate-binding protein [Agrobacterium pusense]|uniref:ABC transporter substrate-binding protein n=1 Tax=Agrobacterium pusense TaxID=648995 RepID=UPI003FD4A222